MVDDACDDLPESELALSVISQSGSNAKLAGQPVKDGHGTHARPLPRGVEAFDGNGALESIQIVLVLEGQSDGGNFLRGALGEIGDCAVFSKKGTSVLEKNH